MISVILPIYNTKAEYLSKCLGGLLRQTMTDFEVLMIDDGSESYVSEICRVYEQQDPRFRYHRQENAGVGVARNTGINYASGEYICFIDADDWFSDDYLEKLFFIIKEADADIAMVDGTVHYAKRTADNHFLEGNKCVLQGEEKNRLLYQLFSRKLCKYYPPEIPAGTVWAKIFRTEFLRENGLRFLPGLARMEDILFCMNAYELATKISYLPKCLYQYRMDEDSVSHRFDPNIVPQFERFFEAAQHFLEQYNKEQLLFDALAMREVTAIHSYLRFYFFRMEQTEAKEINREINALLDRDPYKTAMQHLNTKFLSGQEKLFVTALRYRRFTFLRLLVKGRELLKR